MCNFTVIANWEETGGIKMTAQKKVECFSKDEMYREIPFELLNMQDMFDKYNAKYHLEIEHD